MNSLRMSRRTLALALLAGVFTPPAHAAGGKAQGSQQNKRLTSSKDYVQLSAVTAPIAARYRFDGILVVEFGLDVPDAKLRALAEASKPRLQDGIRAALSDYTHTQYRPGRLPDPDRMIAMMQSTVDKLLGSAGARVLLVSVMVQPGR